MKYILAILFMAASVQADITFTDPVSFIGTEGGINFYEVSYAQALGVDYPDIQPEYLDSVLLLEMTNFVAGGWIRDTSYYRNQAATNGSGGAAVTFKPETNDISAYGEFDGSDKITVSDSDNLSFTENNTNDLPFSLSFWADPDTPVRFRAITKGDTTSNSEYALTGDFSGKLFLFLYDQTTTPQRKRGTTAAMAAGSWHHYVSTYDGTTILFYIDGALAAMEAQTDAGGYVAMHNTTADLVIGSYPPNNSFADGSLDQPIVFSECLTAGQVTNLFDFTKTNNPAWGLDIGGANEEQINPGKGF